MVPYAYSYNWISFVFVNDIDSRQNISKANH